MTAKGERSEANAKLKVALIYCEVIWQAVSDASITLINHLITNALLKKPPPTKSTFNRPPKNDI